MSVYELKEWNMNNLQFGTLLLNSTNNATSVSTGSLNLSGGLGITKDLYVGGNEHVVGDVNIDGNLHPNALYLLTSSGTPANLNYYSTDTFSFNVGGAISGTLTGNFVRLNNVITIKFNDLKATTTSATTIYILEGVGGLVPPNYRPSSDIYAPLMLYDNNNPVFGNVKLSSDGLIVFYNGASGNFTASGSAGIRTGVITYFKI